MVLKIRAKVVRLPFHWNYSWNCCSTEISICCRLGNLDSSLSPLTREHLGYSWTKWWHFVLTSEEKDYLVFTIEQQLWRYAPSLSNLMEWIIKMEPTSRWIFHMIFGIHVLCTETEWRWMFVSNRYKVNFLVQSRYATWQVQIEKRNLLCWVLLLIHSIILLEGLYLTTLALM